MEKTARYPTSSFYRGGQHVKSCPGNQRNGRVRLELLGEYLIPFNELSHHNTGMGMTPGDDEP
jgi:hypothetical protein